MKESLAMDYIMGKVESQEKMGSMMENGLMVCKKDMENLLIWREKTIEDNGATT